jgi:hypothetical protein
MRHYYPDPDEALPWMVQEGVMVRCKVCLPPPTPLPWSGTANRLYPSSSIQIAEGHASSSALPNATAERLPSTPKLELLRALPLLVSMPPRYVAFKPHRLLRVAATDSSLRYSALRWHTELPPWG